jgi:tripartite-type tricarboxylate transporter receptor subunit TctC
MSFDQQRRCALQRVALAAAMTFGGGLVSAQGQRGSTWPERAVQLVVPFTPGTTADTLSRVLGEKLSEQWKVPVVTDNRAGASGIIGTELAANAASNGYTLLFTATAHGTVPALHPKLNFDPLRSFAPVVLLATSALAVVVAPDLPVSNLPEFLELARKEPGKLAYSSPGTGAPQHLTMELFMLETGTRLLHVPYKGSSGALTDLVGGQVQASIVSLQTAGTFVNSGKLKMLAVMSEQRSSAFPSVPTLRELGLPGLVVETWYGVFAPAGTAPDIVARVNSDLNVLLQRADVREGLAKQGLTPAGGKPERLGELVQQELVRWSRVVASTNIKAD